MSFESLDQMIRKAYPDSIERRKILTELHDLKEGTNQCLAFMLKATGHTYNAKDQTWKK